MSALQLSKNPRSLLKTSLLIFYTSFIIVKTKQFFAFALDLLNNSKTAVLLQPCLCCAFLQNLKWLDLKDNPLDPVLAKVAGDCLDEKQCKQAAVKVRSLVLF